MITVEKRIEALIRFGRAIEKILSTYEPGTNSEFGTIISRAGFENPWFTEKNILLALNNWVLALKAENIERWTLPYMDELQKKKSEKNVGVVNAGNIPFAGLHDLISVLLCGHNYSGKNASNDSILLPYLSSVLSETEPAFSDRINFVPRLEKIDAVIATGSNNSARYFEYYFGKYPNIIRKNRNGVGVLSGNETKAELYNSGFDIFSYFGLGCRNVSKLYVPVNYNFTGFFESIEDYNELKQHSKYMNNFDYNNSVFLLKQIPFLQNGFLIVRNEKQISSPVSVLHFEEYGEKKNLINNLAENIDQLQCISSSKDFKMENKELEKIRVDFGKTQSPELWDYADGVDTVRFLTRL